MWYWERYESYPAEQIDDPHLVIILGGQVARPGRGPAGPPRSGRPVRSLRGSGPDAFDDLCLATGEQPDLDELKAWLRFGLDPAVRGHDGVPVPIIDADSLVNFLRFTRSAIEYCNRHDLTELGQLWTSIQQRPRRSRTSTRPASSLAVRSALRLSESASRRFARMARSS